MRQEAELQALRERTEEIAREREAVVARAQSTNGQTAERLAGLRAFGGIQLVFRGWRDATVRIKRDREFEDELAELKRKMEAATNQQVLQTAVSSDGF